MIWGGGLRGAHPPQGGAAAQAPAPPIPGEKGPKGGGGALRGGPKFRRGPQILGGVPAFPPPYPEHPDELGPGAGPDLPAHGDRRPGMHRGGRGRSRSARPRDSMVGDVTDSPPFLSRPRDPRGGEGAWSGTRGRGQRKRGRGDVAQGGGAIVAVATRGLARGVEPEAPMIPLGALVPARFLILTAHLVALGMAAGARDTHVRASLPLEFSVEEYTRVDTELLCALGLAAVLLAIEFGGFFMGVSMFHRGQGLFCILHPRGRGGEGAQKTGGGGRQKMGGSQEMGGKK
uniref:Transmembrane protein 107 n=1 Tax=Anas platyrhynchos TaxID=8839 RepID=A0A8B9SYL4_ANAPL